MQGLMLKYKLLLAPKPYKSHIILRQKSITHHYLRCLQNVPEENSMLTLWKQWSLKTFIKIFKVIFWLFSFHQCFSHSLLLHDQFPFQYGLEVIRSVSVLWCQHSNKPTTNHITCPYKNNDTYYTLWGLVGSDITGPTPISNKLIGLEAKTPF